MTKTAMMGTLVVSGFVAGLLLAACSSKSGGTGGAGQGGGAGATASGAAGSSTGAAGASPSGAAGANADAAVTDGEIAIDGKCSVAGATPRAGGVCQCSASYPSVCDLACTDTQNDNDHCGNCATKCPATSVCVAGKCGAAATPLVPAAAGCTSIKIALAGTTLYWTDSGHGTVKSIGTGAGATVTTVATTQMGPTLLGVFGTTLFWLDSGSKTIMKATVPGGAPTVVYTSATDAIMGFTASPDGGTVYFSAGSHILKVPAAGGTATNIYDQADGIPGQLALEGTTIAFGSDQAQDIDAIYLADGKVSQCGMKNDGGNGFCSMGLRIGRSQGSLLLDTIFLIGGKVHWAKRSDIVLANTMVSATDPSNPEVKITTAANFGDVSAFTIQGTTVYLGEDGFIEKAKLEPSMVEATLMARGQKTPTSIAANADNVYWANGDCAIMAMPGK